MIRTKPTNDTLATTVEWETRARLFEAKNAELETKVTWYEKQFRLTRQQYTHPFWMLFQYGFKPRQPKCSLKVLSAKLSNTSGINGIGQLYSWKTGGWKWITIAVNVR
ncbi:hypothetical protein SAMN05518683_108138 [Salibacterium halotolerans]|uniref:Uncharacterized protein n=1 Tax=Salibacterium halotolerans TaxID=1884432 RepID=A0A1I5SD67_9BACI|nr:hypothetical protein SAMN05518683_108138 [Salibacterium halotolerans]